jgi:hypothetical protein
VVRTAQPYCIGHHHTPIASAVATVSAELEPGELLIDMDFTLFQALTALEMMDPRMDIGAVQLEQKTILSAAQAATVRH